MRYVDQRTVACLDDIDAYHAGREYDSLESAIAAMPTPPCEDRGDKRPCEHIKACAGRELACKAFLLYTREAAHRLAVIDWGKVDRIPSKELYALVHVNNDPKES